MLSHFSGKVIGGQAVGVSWVLSLFSGKVIGGQAVGGQGMVLAAVPGVGV